MTPLTESSWRPRLIESIQLAHQECRLDDRLFRPSDEIIDGLKLDDLRLIAKADLIIPFAAANLLREDEPIGDLPSPAELRASLRDAGFRDRVTSVGCFLAAARSPLPYQLREELSSEYATWLSLCIRAHSYPVLRAIRFLPWCKKILQALLLRPRRRMERLGADGERLVSLLPVQSGKDEHGSITLADLLPLANYLDMARSTVRIFPVLLAVAERSDFWPEIAAEKFLTYSRGGFWPFTHNSFDESDEVRALIRRLRESLMAHPADEPKEARVESEPLE